MNYLIIHNINERFIFSTEHDIVVNNLTKEFILGFSDFIISSNSHLKKDFQSNLSYDDIIDDLMIYHRNFFSMAISCLSFCNISSHNIELRKRIPYNVGLKRYQALIGKGNHDFLMDFDSLDFINGIFTSNAWLSYESHQRISIYHIYDNLKLCHQYIKYDLKIDYNFIVDLLIQYLIKDLTLIVIDY